MAFFRAEIDNGAEVLVPGPRAFSGWGDGLLRGPAVSGLLARAAERAAHDLGDAGRFRTVRWTLDLFHPAGLVATTTEATVVRSGRRLRLVDARLVQDGRAVARASLLLLATGDAPRSGTWDGPAPELPPLPDVRPATSEPLVYLSDGVGWTDSPAPHANSARKATWHLVEAVVEGETPSPLQRVATVADSSNLVSNWGSEGLHFINTDVTLALSRLPSGDGIGLVAERRVENDGIAVGTTTVFDAEGPVGTVVLTSLANGAATIDPRRFGA